MRRIPAFFWTLGLIGLLACDTGKVFEKHSADFDNYEWKKQGLVEFKANIENIEQGYDIYLAVRHIYGFPFKEIDVLLDASSPSGDRDSIPVLVKVIDESNKYFSECAGDYCDLEVLAVNDLRFKEKGQYTFSIGHTNPIDPLPGIMDVGLIIRKKE